MAVEALTKDNFSDEISSGTPILVDFYADWCGPCRVMGPIVDEIAAERSDINVAKVDVDASGDISGDHKVMSIPTFVLFDGKGNEVSRFSGSMAKSALMDRIDNALIE